MPVGKVIQRISDFFLIDIWDWSTSNESSPLRSLHTMSRIAYLVAVGFLKDQCIIRAAALTFTTMLSIVPFLAVAFSLMKGMGFQDSNFIHDMLLKVSAGREEVVAKILEYVDNTNVQTLGWIGVGTLLFTVLSTVGTVEKAFNIIWKVRHGRTFWRKFTDFFSVIFICPVAVIVATSVSVAIKKQAALHQLENIYGMNTLESFLINLTPLVLIWIAFTFVYAFMPNTRVRIGSALAGGVVAGTVWQMAQWAYINWQIGVSKYNAIYGSFAQLPLFLVWLYASWVIVLLGSEISYAVQNVMLYRQQRFMPDAGVEDMQKFSLLALSLMSLRFNSSESPYDVEELATEVGVPVRFISPLLDRFVEGGILLKSAEENSEVYSFAVSPNNVTMLQVMGILSGAGKGASAVVENPGLLFISKMFDDIKLVLRESGCDVSLTNCGENMGKFLKRLPAPPSKKKETQ
ncbi:YihY/virulence factor BrkB family protein [Maridesulfovibrio sp.]|uniref:YihY/virulence factor BrkB family protein n=1 Tax=Maridesulfovibrio sp. TaxID=2795000 RepID=UPI0039EFE8B4